MIQQTPPSATCTQITNPYSSPKFTTNFPIRNLSFNNLGFRAPQSRVSTPISMSATDTTGAFVVSPSGNDSDSSSPSGSGNGRDVEYLGWVYHIGVNSIGREYCHLRFLFLRGRYAAMYKRDPHENPGTQAIRKGAISPTFMVEDLGRRKINDGELYVLRFYNRLDETRKGEIACATAGEAHKWMEAFDQAKQQAAYDLSRGNDRHKLSAENELNLEGHRPRVRRVAHGLRKLIQIGKGPDMLLRQTSDLGSKVKRGSQFEGDTGDAVEAHDWRCVRIENGIRIFEDVSDLKGGKVVLKSVGVIEASLDTVFEVVLSLDKQKRHEWDMLTGDLELVESIDGHCDVVYGTYDPSYLTWWHSKKDFVLSRQWFRGQDGSYTILQFPAVHKKRRQRSGYQRTQVFPSTWELRRLDSSDLSTEKCLLTQMLEVRSSEWNKWKKHGYADFEKTIPYALLCQVAGLREYFGANPTLTLNSSTVVHSTISDTLSADSEFEGSGLKDEFYDAISDESSEDEESDDDGLPQVGKVKLKNVSWAIAGLALKRRAAALGNTELDAKFTPIAIDLSQFHGSLNRGKTESDTNCWTVPSGQGFMIRGKTYLDDNTKVAGGDPLLKLLAVDWFKSESVIDKISLRPNYLVQSDVGKKLPFILVINLQIPSKPNYSLVLYYGADRPIKKDSLLDRFVHGTDLFRDARFKLIPSIVEGYWMVKRAVGSRACLLGKAVTCNYLQGDNYLEIGVDIGSSSVARSIMGLVLGYITGIVVDLAILIEAKEEKELPEYILGTVRLNHVTLESAVTP